MSCAERKRLFALGAGTSWATTTPPSSRPAVACGHVPRSRFRCRNRPVPRSGSKPRRSNPNEVVRAILCAPVDLLWNGGIGTFVKASSETHAEVGDRDTDAVRVDGRELRDACRRRGRQPRADAARAHRVRQRRRPHQHRRDRQLGRGRLLRPRGQHQDPARLRASSGGRSRSRSGTRCSPPPPTRSASWCSTTTTCRRRSSARSRRPRPQRRRGPRDADARAGARHLLDRATRGTARHATSWPSADRQGTGLTRPELAVLLAYAKRSLVPKCSARRFPTTRRSTAVLREYFPAPHRRGHGRPLPRAPAAARDRGDRRDQRRRQLARHRVGLADDGRDRRRGRRGRARYWIAREVTAPFRAGSEVEALFAPDRGDRGAA